MVDLQSVERLEGKFDRTGGAASTHQKARRRLHFAKITLDKIINETKLIMKNLKMTFGSGAQ